MNSVLANSGVPSPSPVPVTSIHRVMADGIQIFYREAGNAAAPVLLLLHGFPTSSFMFRELIPRLADECRVIAPDLPGFGFTEVAETRNYTIESFTEALGLSRYAIYIFDYGAPTGLRLAMRHPERVTAIVSQNGNAYEEGSATRGDRSATIGPSLQKKTGISSGRKS
jgi:pimeloyl-ACP methyl ester carboxylesterase